MKNLSIETLIKQLEELQAKGIANVQLDGTLMCEQDGNSIIASTERQF